MTTILEAAAIGQLAYAAHTYLEAGCSVVTVAGKRADVAWKLYTKQQPTARQLSYWLQRPTCTGIAIICGEVSGGLVVLDVDSQEGCTEFEAAFPTLLQTLQVRSGSGRGKHYYFYARHTPPTTVGVGMELRSNGAYVVAPPSIHPGSGQPYRVARYGHVKAVAELDHVREWIIGRGGGAVLSPRQRPPALPPGAAVAGATKLGLAALAGETAYVRSASTGVNNALYRAALKMGSLIAAGQIPQSHVEAELEAAAAGLSARDGLEATRRTIESGLKVGLRNPRKVS